MALVRVFRHIYGNLGNFLKSLAQKRVGVRPQRPPPLDPRLPGGIHENEYEQKYVFFKRTMEHIV